MKQKVTGGIKQGAEKIPDYYNISICYVALSGMIVAP
jgi:hypothetical protein